MALDEIGTILSKYLNSKPHTHAPEEVLASLDLLWDEMNELEPAEQQLLIETKKRVQKCSICSNSLRALDIQLKALASTS